MNAITVWILVTVTSGGAAITSYSPPIVSQEECVKFQKEVNQVYGGGLVRSKCIQVKIAN